MAWAVAERERRRREVEEKARKEEETQRRCSANQAVRDSIREYDHEPTRSTLGVSSNLNFSCICISLFQFCM
jgi:IS5 family transposase